MCSEAKRIFAEKARIEWEYRTEGIALPADWISSLEVLVSYEAWIELLHYKNFFKEVSSTVGATSGGITTSTPSEPESDTSEEAL